MNPFIPAPFTYGDIPSGGVPAILVVSNAAPGTSNNQYQPGTFWLVPEPQTSGSLGGNIYYLAGFSSGVPQWELFATASGDVSALANSSGTSGTPNSSGQIQITGTANQITFTAGTNKITASLIGPYSPATYTADGILYGNGTSGIGATAPLANGQTLVGGAAGSAPVPTYISNANVTYVPKFTNIPTMSASTGGVAAVTINTYNVWAVPQWGAAFEQYNTTASTAIAPSMSTTAGFGLDIDTITGAASKSIEITEGNTVNSKNAFVIGTSAAFYAKASFNINTLVDVTDLYLGFRKVQTYQATIPAGYTDYATIGVHGTAGLIEIQTQVGSGGNPVTSTTQSA